MNAAVTTLRKATETIWTTPPKGLDGLATMYRPPSADLPKRLYANFDAYWLAGMLYQLRELCAAAAMDRATLAAVASMVAETAVTRFTTWGFQDAAATISAVVPGIKASDNLDGLREILAELVTFIDRMHVWIDTTIPWSAMDVLKPLPIDGGDA